MDWTFVLLKRFSFYTAIVLFLLFLIGFPEDQTFWLAFLVSMIGAALFQTLINLIVYQPLPTEGELQNDEKTFAQQLAEQSPIHKLAGKCYLQFMGDLGRGIGFFFIGNFLAILVGFAVIRSSFAWSGGVLWPLVLQCIVFSSHYPSPLKRLIDWGYDAYSQFFLLDRETEAEVVEKPDAFVATLIVYTFMCIVFVIWRVLF